MLWMPCKLIVCKDVSFKLDHFQRLNRKIKWEVIRKHGKNNVNDHWNHSA